MGAVGHHVVAGKSDGSDRATPQAFLSRCRFVILLCRTIHLSGFPRTVTFNTLLILLRQIAPKRDTARRHPLSLSYYGRAHFMFGSETIAIHAAATSAVPINKKPLRLPKNPVAASKLLPIA